MKTPEDHTYTIHVTGSLCPLNKSWEAYTDAIEAGVRSDAIRIIELQAENEALKSAMRNFKNKAVAMRPRGARPSISSEDSRSIAAAEPLSLDCSHHHVH